LTFILRLIGMTSSDAKAVPQGHRNWLKTNPQITAEVEGHRDERGTNDNNLALGAKRAESVKRYLIDRGIAAERISTISYGEELPLCKEPGEVCWAKNRRAHFVVKNLPAN
jgi:peptidoglycan-associated lipoprotein